MDNIEIGKRIKQSREEKGMSLQDVADLTGVARSTVQRYETGKIDKIKLPILESSARSLEVRPDWIIGKTDKKCLEADPVPEILHYYKSLNTVGKNIATEQVRLLTLDEKYTNPDNVIPIKEKCEHPLPTAAHADDYAHAPEELKQLEDDIMADKNF